MPKKYKPGVGWAVVTPPDYSLDEIRGWYVTEAYGPKLLYYGAVFRSKTGAVRAAKRWPGSKVVKVSVTLWGKDA